MGLPFETPGGYQDDNTTPDTGRYSDDLTTPDYDGYSHDLSGGYQAGGEDAFFEDDYDVEGDEPDGPAPGDQSDRGDRPAWDTDTGPFGLPDQL
jgi:hypothetical protein